MRWTRQRQAREVVRRAVIRERAKRAGRTALKRTANRVVLTPVAGAKPAEVCEARPGDASRQFAGDGGKRNSSPGSNCVFVDLRTAGLKAGAARHPPPAADGLDPVRPPGFRLGMRSAEAERDRLLCDG